MQIASQLSHILAAIPELGLISIRGRGVKYVPPRTNACDWRAPPVLDYLQRYADHRRIDGEYFLCLYDGWREYSAPCATPVFVPWRDVDPGRFAGTGADGEPRFIHRHADGIFPVLPRPVLTFCRHAGDTGAWLIPDAEFLETRFKRFLDDVRASDCGWDDKRGDVLYWRGQRRSTNSGDSHVRDLIARSEARHLDARLTTETTIADQLRYKYLLDVDGMVSAWSGLFWKLASNSVPVKVRSHWEQWYYRWLRDGESIVLTDLDFEQTFRHLARTDGECHRISQCGRRLAERLSYQFACEEYVIG